MCPRTAPHPMPSHAFAQWLPVLTGPGLQLPAYSGGTAWAFHPLRVTAGQSRRCDFAGSTSIVPASITCGSGTALACAYGKIKCWMIGFRVP
jgi:hypothetical protein